MNRSVSKWLILSLSVAILLSIKHWRASGIFALLHTYNCVRESELDNSDSSTSFIQAPSGGSNKR